MDKNERESEVQLRFGLYRDSMFDDDISNDGSPFPPSDDDQVPDSPTDLVLENEVTWVWASPSSASR